MALHPDAQAFLSKMASVPEPQDVPLEDFRRAASALIHTGPPLAIGKVDDLEVPGGDGQPMRIRIYRPQESGRHPLAVWAHGGSFVRGTLDMFDPGRRAFVKASGIVVIAVDQRLSPEAQFPEPLEDVDAALQWARAHAAELGADPSRIGVAGESSGANLAAAVAIMARDRSNNPPLAFQLLLEPLTDAGCDTPSMRELGQGYVLTRRQLLWAYEQYAPTASRDNPYLSPLRAELGGLPPAVIVTLEYDPVRDDGERYAERLAAAGVRVLKARIPGMLHHFPGPDFVPTAVRLLRELLEH
jgi:acetyl esterase